MSPASRNLVETTLKRHGFVEDPETVAPRTRRSVTLKTKVHFIMYRSHRDFEQPADETAKVWRYMDFTKFLSLLESEKLYFTRSDKFDDPFEGAVPLSNVMARGNSIMRLFAEHKDIPDSAKMAIAELMIDKPDQNRATKKQVALNCWHMNEHESAAMWKLYLQGSEGIAIHSTYQQLRDSIIDEEPVQLGCVKYIDYEKDGFREHTLFTAFVHKRKSFEHEREVRACIWKPPITPNGFDYQLETIDQGLSVKVDIKSLIQKIYIAPTAQSWFAELVKSVMAKYGFDFEVVHSTLFSVPLF